MDCFNKTVPSWDSWSNPVTCGPTYRPLIVLYFFRTRVSPVGTFTIGWKCNYFPYNFRRRGLLILINPTVYITIIILYRCSFCPASLSESTKKEKKNSTGVKFGPAKALMKDKTWLMGWSLCILRGGDNWDGTTQKTVLGLCQARWLNWLGWPSTARPKRWVVLGKGTSGRGTAQHGSGL